MDYNIEQIIKNTEQNKNMHQKINNMILTQSQIVILNKYHINYNKCNTMNELLYYIDNYLNYKEAEDLERVSEEIAEFNYYMNTNK